MSQLDISWLQSDTFGVYGKEVCILQKGDEVVLRCFVQCINCSYCPSGNKTPVLFCLRQRLRINLLLFVQMPPLADTDVLDHPGLKTCIFTIFDIRTNNYNTCIFTIFDVFDMKCMYFILFTIEREPLGCRVPSSSDNDVSLSMLGFQGATS